MAWLTLQTAKDVGWNSTLSIDEQSTIASFSACLTGKDDDDDIMNELVSFS